MPWTRAGGTSSATGRCVCSGTQSESNSRASAATATVVGVTSTSVSATVMPRRTVRSRSRTEPGRRNPRACPRPRHHAGAGRTPPAPAGSPNRPTRPAARHQRGDGSGGRPGMGGDACGQGDGLVEDGAGRTGPQRQPKSHQLRRVHPVRGEQDACSLLPPHGRRKQDAARRLGWHAELGKGNPQPRPSSTNTRSQWASRVKPKPTPTPATAARSGTSMLPMVSRNPLNPRSDPSTTAPVARAAISRRSAPEENAPPRPVRTTARTDSSPSAARRGGGGLEVHRGVERVADLRPVKGDDTHSGRGVLGLDAAHCALAEYGRSTS